MAKKNEATRGSARVKVGAKCTGGKHGACTVQDCECSCHSREFLSWQEADVESVKTGRKMTYHQGVFTV